MNLFNHRPQTPLHGILLYSQKDIADNQKYIDWLISEFASRDLFLSLVPLHRLSSYRKQYSFAVNRSRSFEAALWLEQAGIRVFNSADVALLGNHKLAAYHMASRLGIPYLPLPTGFQLEEMRSKSPARRYVRKPNDGHGGKDITFFDKASAPEAFGASMDLLQEYGAIVRDTRHYIIGNKLVHSIARESYAESSPAEPLLHNFKQGASISITTPDEEERRIIDKILERHTIDFAGIDILKSRDGTCYFGELEDVVGSRMLSELGINNTTVLFAEHIRNSLSI